MTEEAKARARHTDYFVLGLATGLLIAAIAAGTQSGTQAQLETCRTDRAVCIGTLALAANKLLEADKAATVVLTNFGLNHPRGCR